MLFPLSITAQEPGTIGRVPGAPAGSYSLNDNDNVNLFNLNLNYRLSVLNDKGRGELPIDLGVVIEQQLNYQEVPDSANPSYYFQNYIVRTPNPHSFVGHIRLDINRSDTGEPCDEDANHWWEYRVRMVYVSADGTEETLRDGVIHSTPKNMCVAGVTSLNLGNTFESDSGSFIKFVTDSNIHIRCEVVSGCSNNLSGYLYFPNGVKARVVGDNWVEQGYITSMTDRNGNKITYDYSTESYITIPKKVTKITDSNSREISIAYDVDEGSPYGVCTKITYKGFGGETRVIRISEDNDPVIRHTQSYDNYSGEIFHDDPNDNMYAPTVSGDNWPYVNAVWLPDGRSYQFKYNVMGKLARVDLPTGGATEYDYAEFSSLPYYFWEGTYGPTNYVSEKRIYDANNNLINTTAFSTPLPILPV
jgi:YD repeat-containing protein